MDPGEFPKWDEFEFASRKVMHLDLKKVAEFVSTAETDDLLDRVTVYREGMEPAAVFLMEEELERRGIDRDQIEAHAESYEPMALRHSDGTVRRCAFCDRPAVLVRWGWLKLWRLVPILPWKVARCVDHAGIGEDSNAD